MDNGASGWMAALAEEDRHFLKRFLLASGSLKALAAEYGVSYPTVRSRLDRLIAKEERAAVVAALDRLPPKQRSVFVMRHFHGMPNREIAEVLSCSTSAVKANLSYALKSLREKLAGGSDRE